MVDHSDFYVRQAIWEARGKRCVYCMEPLSFRNLEIDHVIPQSLVSNLQERERILGEQGLEADFDILGLTNLVSSCNSCNGKKLAAQFPAGRTAIELLAAKRALTKVEALIKKFKAEDNMNKLRLGVVAAVKSGQLTPDEIIESLAQIQKDPGSFRLSSDFWQSNGIPLFELSKSDIDRYLTEQVIDEELRLVNDKDQELYVTTLKAYQEALAQGYFAYSTYEMGVAAVNFERPLTILNILETLKIAEKNYIDEPRLGLADIAILPADLLFVTEEITTDPAFKGQKARLASNSIQELIGGCGIS
jgi:hypothetical protein